MEPDTPNHLHNEKLAGYHLFYDKLAKLGGKSTLIYSLDEFGWELGVYALRKKDADVVMGFLGDLSKAVKTERLDVGFDAEKKIPIVWLTSGRFPKINVRVSLGLEEGYIHRAVASAGSESDRLWLVPDNYKERRDEYSAWQNALRLLSKKAEGKLELIAEPLGIVPHLGMKVDGTGVCFSARADISDKSVGYGSHQLSLNEILDRTLAAFELVHCAYAVTDNLPKLIVQRNDELAQQLLSKSGIVS